MGLRELAVRVDHAPTVMDAVDELRVARALMRIPAERIVQDWEAFDAITGHLYESHTDSFYEVTPEILPHFRTFARWLHRLAGRATGERAAWLHQLAEHFTIDPRQVEAAPSSPQRAGGA